MHLHEYSVEYSLEWYSRKYDCKYTYNSMGILPAMVVQE